MKSFGNCVSLFVCVCYLAFFTLLAGCDASAHAAPAETDNVPLIAATIGSLESKPTVSPAPKVDPAGVCPNCKGKGSVGDGRTMVTCKACNGSGKLGAAMPANAVLVTNAGEWVQQCNGRSCRMVPANKQEQQFIEPPGESCACGSSCACAGETSRGFLPRRQSRRAARRGQ